MSLIVGCDPGFSGAFCFMLGTEIRVVPMPVLKAPKSVLDEKAIKSILQDDIMIENALRKARQGEITHFFIERAMVMPRQGVVSSGRFMEQYGFLRGLCVGMGIPYTVISSVRWKKVLMDGMPKEKEASLVRVAQLYPNLKLTGPKVSRIGQADAVLIARYGQSTLTSTKKVHIGCTGC